MLVYKPMHPSSYIRSKFSNRGLSACDDVVTLVDSCRPATCDLPLLDSRYIGNCRLLLKYVKYAKKSPHGIMKDP